MTAIRYAALGYLAALGIVLGWISRQIDRAVTIGGAETP